MKKILLINPNTCEDMTKQCGLTAKRVLSGDIEAEVINPSFGPRSLESFYEYTLAGFASLREYKKLINSGKKYDGVLLACFGDPCLYGLKNIAESPAIGIAEASFSLSCVLGQRFGLLVTTESAVSMMYDLVRQYGFESRCAAIESINTSVLDTESRRDESIKKLIESGRKAVGKGAEVLILGCAGMTGMKKEISDILQIPVIDPVEAGCIMLEGIIRVGMDISHCGLYSRPPEKEIIGGNQVIGI